MKTNSILRYTSALVAIAGLSFLPSHANAAQGPMFGQISLQFGGHPHDQSYFNDDQRGELRHIYWRLEHANADYNGHRQRALEEIRRAADMMGMDLHGTGYAQNWQRYNGPGGQPESQSWSDDVLRRMRDRLRDLADVTGGPVQDHMRAAVHQLDRALETR